MAEVAAGLGFAGLSGGEGAERFPAAELGRPSWGGPSFGEKRPPLTPLKPGEGGGGSFLGVLGVRLERFFFFFGGLEVGGVGLKHCLVHVKRLLETGSSFLLWGDLLQGAL